MKPKSSEERCKGKKREKSEKMGRGPIISRIKPTRLPDATDLFADEIVRKNMEAYRDPQRWAQW